MRLTLLVLSMFIVAVSGARAGDSLGAVFERARTFLSVEAALPHERSLESDPSLQEAVAFIRATAREKSAQLRETAGLVDGVLERQAAFLEYLAALDPLPAIVSAQIDSIGMRYEFYDASRNRIVVDRELAPAPRELRAAVVVHSLRHYFAVTRKEPRARGRTGQHDAFEAQAIFWTVVRRPGKGVLHRHHEALARAYADGKMPELLDRLRRGMLW